MATRLQNLNQKLIRSQVILDHMLHAGYLQAVCFSCGHAAQALRDVGVDVLEIGPNGDLEPRRWFTPEEISLLWPQHFDATPGHLPIYLMERIAAVMRADRRYQGVLGTGRYEVPSGSGETLLCLAMAYPQARLYPIFDVGLGTAYEPEAPLMPALIRYIEAYDGGRLLYGPAPGPDAGSA